jgi:hypothetical protein
MRDATGAIYVPPKSGLPFLVVTFQDGGMRTETAASRSEARALLARRTRGVEGAPAKAETAATQ